MLDSNFVKTLDDWITWYNYHRANASNAGVEKKLEFQHKAINGLFFVVAAMADELARIDGMPRTDKPLVVPVGVSWKQ
jgi:hypothetical protein